VIHVGTLTTITLRVFRFRPRCYLMQEDRQYGRSMSHVLPFVLLWLTARRTSVCNVTYSNCTKIAEYQVVRETLLYSFYIGVSNV
jgi:hypothetical protein